MKLRMLLSSLLLSGSFCLLAQDFPYEVSVITRPYEPLTDATEILPGEVWDDPDYFIPIGFPFEAFGTVFDTLYNPGFVGVGFMDNIEFTGPALLPYGSDLIDRGALTATSQSQIFYKLDGTAPDRILKVEYRNAGFFDELSGLGVNDSYVNFQFWLYEGSNNMEVLFGDREIVSDVHFTDGTFVGFFDAYNFLDFVNGWHLSGTPEAPTVYFVDGSDPNWQFGPGVDPDPDPNTVFRFSLEPFVDTEEAALAAGTQVFPNPFGEVLSLQFDLPAAAENLELRVFDLLGQAVYSERLGEIQTGRRDLLLTGLPAGAYTVQLRDGQEVWSTMVVKQ